MYEYRLERGSLFLIGIDDIVTEYLSRFYTKDDLSKMINRRRRDGDEYHLTVINMREMKNLHIEYVKAMMGQIPAQDLDLNFIGIGSARSPDTECRYIVCVSEALSELRRRIRGLKDPDYDFHVTVDFTNGDLFDVDKSPKTLIKYDSRDIIDYVKSMNVSSRPSRCMIEWILDKCTDKKILDVAYDMFCHSLRQIKGSDISLWRRVIKTLRHNDYLHGLYLDLREEIRGLKITDVVKRFTDAITGRKIITVNDKFIKDYLFVLNNPIISNIPWMDAVGSRDKFFRFYRFDRDMSRFRYTELPRNFSSVTPTVWGSSIPSKREYFEIFEEIGIDTVVTIMEDPLDKSLSEGTSIKVHHCAVDDQTPPSTEQMLDIVKVMSESSGVLVHCMGGVGRTATVILAYLMLINKISLSEAKQYIKYRKTILSDSQVEFLKDWYAKCITGKFTAPRVKKRSDIKLPSLVMLVGLPASGKSTFSKVVEDQILNITRVNQDEIRTKGRCDEMVGSLTKRQTVLLDRCNLSREERKYWLSLNMGAKPWCIHFNASPEECKWRIKYRTDHPTVRAHSGGRIIDGMIKKLDVPAMDEGFDKIITVSSFKEANQLLLKIGCDISELTEVNHDNIIKFPRTKHMHNLGSATRDDLLLDKSAIDRFMGREIYVEEKIDGANMGLSIKDYKIVAQNRSHYVNSSYHTQFKLLDKWISDHMSDLWQILEDESKILYGEWVYAQHSIHYTALPDYFIAFDLYDKHEKRFYSRERLENILDGTDIKLVPLMYRGIFNDVSDLVKMVNTPSKFYNGPIEGVYVRRCNERWLEDRTKIVRHDFLSGNEHWSKGIITPNKLAI